MERVGFRNLLVERFARQLHPALLLERDGNFLVLDQITVAFRLRPTASRHRGVRRGIFAQPKRFGIQRINLVNSVVNFDLRFVLTNVVMQTTELMQHFHVPRIVLQQSPQCEDANIRPASRHRRFFEDEIRLAMVRLVFQNLFDHFHRALRVLFHFSLRFHHRDGRGRDIEKTFLGRFVFCDLRAP